MPAAVTVRLVRILSPCPTATRWSRCGTPATTSPACRKRESGLPEWQVAINVLILVVELGGPTMLARIGVMRALNRHVERAFNLDRKETH
jgi:hypothetical protein